MRLGVNMNLFDLAAKITLDSSEYEQGLDNAEKKSSSFGSKVKTALSTGAKVGVAAIGALTTGTIALGTAIVGQTGKVASYGDNIDKMSQKMGLSAEAYQEWDFIMQHNGTTIESLKTGMKTLATAVESGNDAFGRLGITEEQIASMNNEELFSTVIKQLQGVTDETERTYLTGQLLGRGATELGPLLNMTAEELDEMRQQAHDLGGVLSDEAVKSAAAYQDSLQNLQTQVGGLSRGIISQFLPAVNTIMDGLTAIFGGDKSGVAQVSEGVKTMLDGIISALPDVAETGILIIQTLAEAIFSNIPAIVDAGIKIVGRLVDSVLTMISETDWSQVGKNIVNFIMNIDWASLITGAASLLGGIAGALFGLFTGIFDELMSNLGEWMYGTFGDFADLTWQGFLDGLLKALGDIGSWMMDNVVDPLVKSFADALGLDGDAAVQAMHEWVTNTMDVFLRQVDAAVEWGANLVNNVKTGFSNAWNGVKTFFTNTFNSITDIVKKPFDKAKDIVKNAIDFIKGLFKFEWSLPKLKLPHFSIGTGVSVLGIDLPKINVEWYKKAYENPYLFDRPTVVHTAGGLKGFGDGNGDEMVYGRESLMRDIREAVGMPVVKLYIDRDRLVGGTADVMDSQLGNMQELKLRWEGA